MGLIMNRKIEKMDVGVIVGRFQVPNLHDAHYDLIKSVCEEHPKVIVFLGLSVVRGTRNNPLDFESRKQMILEAFPNVNVLYIADVNNDELWSKKLDEQINHLVSPGQSVMLYGSRDSFITHYTGKYATQELEQNRFVSGTEIRKEISAKVRATADFRAGAIWASHNQYPKVFSCVDVAIFDSKEEKLLLARKPNETLFRFVGGFADPKNSTFEADGRREVAEETGATVGGLVYVGSFQIDDWRYRNEVDKIRTILFKATYQYGGVKPDDDIAELRWFDVAKVTNQDIVPEHRFMFDCLFKRAGQVS